MAYTAETPSTGKMRANDGASVPRERRSPTKKGPLYVNTNIDNSEEFNSPTMGNRAVNGKIAGMDSWQQSVNLDDPGLDASGGCFVKHGTPYGESAMFNQLPPGQDISDQTLLLIHPMPLRKITAMGYPEDGAFPVRDVPE
jgi:hypothetical protein